ncbi:hypothetical protein HMPREF1248_1595 [Coriobacteriaceae bacterium BV3Ac1]|nr:hypothetical protein HMPREF1248_1595 [Coriobacteriaceae bacterium BV3Ac1]
MASSSKLEPSSCILFLLLHAFLLKESTLGYPYHKAGVIDSAQNVLKNYYPKKLSSKN